MVSFGPKQWVIPFGKMSIFRLFDVVEFIAYIAEKKKLEKGPFLDQNHGLICLQKSQFFGFLNLFFYSLKGFIFVLEYRKRHFPGLYCLKKSSKNGHFWTKAMG